MKIDEEAPLDSATAVGETQARSELREYLHSRDERLKLFPKAMLVGLIAGFVGTAFRFALAVGDLGRDRLVAWAHRAPVFGWIAPVLVGSLGAVGSLWVVKRFAPETAGSGIPHLEAVLHRYRTLRWVRVLVAKFVAGAVGIGAGLTLGREGPTVQMGGATGMGVAKMLRSSPRESLTLTAAGAGAGLAAAFNAPLAGVVFVLEELQRDFRPTVFGAAFLAAACSDVVARLCSGQVPSLSVHAYPTPSLELLPAFAVLGLAAGIFGIWFNRSLIGSLNRFAALGARRSLTVAGVVGALVGIVAYFAPSVVGGGHSLAETTLAGNVAFRSIPLLLVLRFGLLMLCYGMGAPGGIFAPLLVVGALFGLGFGQVAGFVFPGAIVHPGVFAVVGMAAYFTSIVRAPLTGIVLIVEMTQSYAQMLPLIVACLCAYVVAEAMGDLPIYEALLQRDLLRGGESVALVEPMVLEMEVQPGAPFEGKPVRELGLRPGVVLVGCREGDREWVPTADTRLRPHIRVTAVISPDSNDGLEHFRDGCRKVDEKHRAA